jgi:hypothetical protein
MTEPGSIQGLSIQGGAVDIFVTVREIITLDGEVAVDGNKINCIAVEEWGGQEP